jgi:hypothetical protein
VKFQLRFVDRLHHDRKVDLAPVQKINGADRVARFDGNERLRESFP